MFTPLLLASALALVGPEPASPAPSSPAGVAWIVFVDDLHINFTNTGRLHTLLDTFVTELVREGDSVTLLSSGPSGLGGAPAPDRKTLDEQIRGTSGAALRLNEVLDAMSRGHDEVSYRMNVALTTVQNALKALEPQNDKRTAVLYVSNGYVSDPAAGEFDVLIDEARRAGISIFAIDPRTMPGGLMPDPNVSSADWGAYVIATRKSLRAISERTGGFAIVDGDLREGLARVSTALRK